MHTLAFLDPGHFHAALTLRERSRTDVLLRSRRKGNAEHEGPAKRENPAVALASPPLTLHLLFRD